MRRLDVDERAGMERIANKGQSIHDNIVAVGCHSNGDHKDDRGVSAGKVWDNSH